MNNIISQISEELKEDLIKYEKLLKTSLQSDVKLINVVVNYAMKRKGKRFRPMLCMLCSRLNNKNPNDYTFLSAATVEILHVATLLHDDVIDDANIRRSWPSVNKIWYTFMIKIINVLTLAKILKKL